MKKQITKAITQEEITQKFKSMGTGYDSRYIWKKANEELEKKSKGENCEITSETNYYKAMTLLEFDKGLLLANSVAELDQVFVIDFCKNLQIEFNCKTAGEKSLAESVALNFVRTLELQRKITNYLSKGEVTNIGVGYLNFLSKELDRANRHYLASYEAIRNIRNPITSMNIRTNTAVVAQNQIVQVKNP